MRLAGPRTRTRALAIAFASPGPAQLRLDVAATRGEVRRRATRRPRPPGRRSSRSGRTPAASRAARSGSPPPAGRRTDTMERSARRVSRSSASPRAARRLGRRQVEGPGEDGECAEQLLLLGREQVVGPADGVLHRPVAGVAPTAGGLQQTANRSSRRCGDLCKVDRPGPGRGELDRQRDPVEAPADLDDRAVRSASLSSNDGSAALARVDEERHRRGALEATPGEGPRPRRSSAGRQWIDRPHLLTGHARAAPGSRHDRDGRRLPQDPADQGGHRLDEVLAVVEDEELSDGAKRSR